MSPRDLDASVVQTRLSVMRELLDDLSAVGDVTMADLQDDRMLRYAVERILGQLVAFAVSINSHIGATELGDAPRDYRESFDLLESAGIVPSELAGRLHRSVGLRNVLTHEYVCVDLSVVAEAVASAQRDYGQYVRLMARWLQGRLAPPR